jgi:hypothetical protein
MGFVAVAAFVGSQVYNAVKAEDLEDQSYAAGEEQKRQGREQQKIADIKNMREQRDLVRRSRIQRATIANYAANSGTQGSSGAAGAISSVGSQTASNLGYFSAAKDANATIFASQQREAGFIQTSGKIQQKMATATAIGNLASTVFDATGGFKTLFD